MSAGVEGRVWIPAYIGLGSNLDDPVVQVRRALEALSTLVQTLLISVSSLYGSRPMGPVAQPEYCNAVAGLLTRLPLPDLWRALHALEATLGRVPSPQRWGPRRIDLDLLAYGEYRHRDAQLTVPHPGIVARNFVLYPWAEIAPEFRIAGLGTVRQLAGRRDREGLWQL